MLFDTYGKFVFFDGAMGTMLRNYGLSRGVIPDIMNMTAPDAVEDVIRLYIEAGSDIVCTNTFGSNSLNLDPLGYSPEEVITAAVTIARRARENAKPETPASDTVPALIALDIGPTGQLIEPYGDMEFDQAYEIYKQMAIAGERAGADVVAIETMSDIVELKAAMIAVTENTNLPILATMTFDKKGRTFMGCTVESFVEAAESHGASAVGLNCSLEPREMLATAAQIANATGLPLIIKPNAGLPDEETGHYLTGATAFAEQMLPFAKIGARIVGGCCGTTPEYIKELRKAFLSL